MKKYLLIAVALCLLAGCAAPAPETVPTESTETTTTTAATESTGTTAMTVTETTAATATTTAAVTNTTAVTTATTTPAAALSLPLPESAAVYSSALAQTLLKLCTGGTAERTRALFTEAGFTTVLQKNFDKPADSAAHTCAWSLGKCRAAVNGEVRTVLLIAVRGTAGGEWYSNFDFAPSHKADTTFAENFLAAANEVFAGIGRELSAAERPLLLVCGHSRGAACANLLGVLLDALLPPEDVYVYTYATPATVRGEAAERSYPNIFNLINPADIVTRLPMASLGYRRAGTDLILSADAGEVTRLDLTMATLSKLAPDIPAYYNDRHSLTGAGLSDNGMTAYELMLSIGRMLAGNQGAGLPTVSPDSDFAPMLALLAGKGDGSDAMQRIATQHMPTRYAELIAQAK